MRPRSNILLLYAMTVVAIAIRILSYAGMAQVSTLEQQAAAGTETRVPHIASETSTRMADMASIMQVTAGLPQVKDTSFAHLVSAENKGIPEGTDVEKRQIAKDILASNQTLTSSGSYLPTETCTWKSRFLDRRTFQGQTLPPGLFPGRNSQRPAVPRRSLHIAAATGSSAAALAVPVYSEDKSLTEVLIAIMNLRELNNRTEQAFGLGDNDRLVYIGQNNHK